ncbi:BglG family transcription antiterminator [Sporosarcina sp. 6E9]|uniref:BglG family transcription antiterminator n=1 Tax=Sporosarcina sp. 6E9 TaxID=2819235 RepID=UPI001B317514|nr:BglG family transcription antiterminator [Sporosarcina sp. 6E9]
MYISAREKLIVEILLDKRDELTIKDLAEEIGVSSRTIHRDLKGIEKLLNEHDLGLVRKTGVGIQITGSEENKENLKRRLMTLSLQDYMADERQTLILCTLYEATGPVKLFTLANELRVTAATISADLIKLEEQLEHFQLSILRKRGYGIELSGPEKAKRRAISYVIAKSLKEDEFLSLIEGSLQKKFAIQENAISERLLHLVDREKLLVIEDVMRELKNDTLISITDNAYVGLIVHLALAIERIKQGEKIEMNKDFLNQLKQEPEYETARKIISQLISRFNIEIPEAEIGYITMHLQGAKLRQNEENLLEVPSFTVMMQAKRLIQNVEEITGYQLTNNAPLLEGLVTHLRPALYRIEQNMGITNPLIQSIRKDYKDLFQIVSEACEKVFTDIKIPDEEIGFLVMHFGSAIIGLTGKNNLKAYVVCSSGIGTSKMLATQLRREIREIEEVRNVSVFELNELQISDRDLVISTIHLQDFSHEYIMVSPFLTTEEVTQIELFVKRKMLIKAAPELKEHVTSIEAIVARMERIQFYTEAVADLLAGFQHTTEEDGLPLETCIQNMCEHLERKQVIKNAEVITEALFAREALGGFGIPDTKLALFHTKHGQVLKPSFTVHTLREPIVMKAMDGNDIEVHQVLLLLSPDPYHEPGLEVLSLISTLIIESEQSIELFESKDETLIHAYLGSKLERFVDEKIKN